MERCDPLVTVVVPAYNHEDYVTECLSSIVEQDYPSLELIVINDGSTDSTAARIKEFMAGRCAGFRYISKENEGLVRTLNMGLSLAKGKYFCQIGSDDLLVPGSIRSRVEFLETHPDVDVVFADAYLMYGRKKTTERLYGTAKRGYRSAEHTLKDLLTRDARIFLPTGMFKRTLLKALGGFDEDFTWCEDTFMKYMVALHARVEYLDKVVMYHRKHDSNVSGSWLRIMPDKILAMEKLHAMVERGPLKRLVEDKLYKYNLKYFEKGMKSEVDSDRLTAALENAIRIRPYASKSLYYRLFVALGRIFSSGP